MNDGMRWSGRKAFGHWLGLICPECKKRIPCMWNYTSLLVLALLSPLWYLPYRFYFRDRPTDASASSLPLPKLVSPPPLPIEPKPVSWINMAVGFGIAMWIAMAGIPAWRTFQQTGEFSTQNFVSSILIWSVAGLAFGLIMRFFLSRQGSKKPEP